MIARIREYLKGPGVGPLLVKAMTGSAGLRLVGMFFGFLVGVQLARGLGPSGYGLYGTVVALVTVLMIPTEFGVPMLVMREVAAFKSRGVLGAAVPIVKWAIRWVTLTATILAVIGGVVLHFRLFPNGEAMGSVLAVGLLWVPILAIGNIYAAALRGSHLIVTGQIGELFIRPVLTSGLLLLATWGVFGTLTPTTAMFFNVVAAAAALTYSLTAFIRSPAYSNGAEPTGLSIRAAIPMGMSEGMRILAGQVGVLMLGFTVPQDQVGIYRVAFGIYVVTTMPSSLINSVCSPLLSSLHAEGRKEALARLNLWMANILIGSSLVCLVLGTLFGDPLVVLLFGEEYRAATKVLLILMVGEVAASLLGHPTVVLNMLRQQRVVMLWSGSALAVNVLTTWWLINAIGYIGAAFGSALGQVLWRAGCAAYAKRQLDVDTSWVTLLLHSPKGVK